MVKKLTLLALMASMAIAAPTYGGNHDLGLGGLLDAHVSIAASAGFTGGVASALEACWAGAPSAVVDVDLKVQLAAWINGAGKQYFDFLTRGEINKWCTAADYELSILTKAAISAALSIDAGVSAVGGVLVFLNNHIETSIDGDCACRAIDLDLQVSLKALLADLKVDVAVSANILGALEIAAAGGVAATLSADVLAELNAWLAAGVQIDADLLVALQAWVSVGAAVDVGVQVGANVILNAEEILALTAFIDTAVFATLDVHVQAGLKAAVAAGVAISLDASVQIALAAFINDLACPLDVDLKAAIGLWLAGEVNVGVEVAADVNALAYVDLGLDVSANIDVDGILTVDGQVLVAGLLAAVDATIDADILASLDIFAQGGLATSLDVSAALKLSAWLISADCTIDAELKALVLVWLSLGITGTGNVGVGIDAGAGLVLDVDAIVSVIAGISASVELSAVVKAAIAVAVAGDVASSVSVAARAELAAFLVSDVALSLGVDVQIELIAWLIGYDHHDCGCN